MKPQIGGLKLKNKKKTGFKPVYDMINSDSGNLQLLTYKSLKGFMITVNVIDNDSEYLTLNSNNKFMKPVTSFILKFAIITPNNDTSLPHYKTISKSSESQDSYFEEAKLQQNIWKKSISGGRPAICPPVANFSLFDNDNSERLLNFLRDKTDSDTKDIFRYLLDYVEKNRNSGIGVIVMPTIENSTTLSDFIRKPNETKFNGIVINNITKNSAKSHVSAQISRLFLDIGVIHFDLHAGNALIYITPTNEIKSLIIDFGRASNFMSDVDDDYLKKNEKELFQGMKDEFFNSLFDVVNKNDDDKIEFIISLLDNIAYVDHTKNQEKFNYSDKKAYQMDWYRDYPKNNKKVVMNAFEILKESISVKEDKIQPKTITTYEKEGLFINFNNDINTFIVPFPEYQQTDMQSSNTKECTNEMVQNGMCTIMGGRKTKTYKKQSKQSKQSKTRRIKKTRKYSRM